MLLGFFFSHLPFSFFSVQYIRKCLFQFVQTAFTANQTSFPEEQQTKDLGSAMGMGREMLLLPIKLKAFRSALKFSCGVRIWLQSCVNKGYFNSLVGWGGRWLLLKRLVKLQQNISFSILSIFPPLQREKKKSFKMETRPENDKSHQSLGVL